MIAHIFNDLSQDGEKSSNISKVNRNGPLAFLLLEGIDIHMTCQENGRSRSVSPHDLGVLTCEGM